MALNWNGVHADDGYKQRMPLGNRKRIFFVGACFVCLGFIVWWSLRNPLRARAAVAIDSLANGQYEQLYQLAVPEEINEGGLSRKVWSNICEKLVKPRLEGLATLGKSDVFMMNEGRTAQATVPVRLPNGDLSELAFILNQTEEGGKAGLLQTVLWQAWILDYRAHRSTRFGPGDVTRARLEGLKKDKPFLDSLGVTGFLSDPSRGVEPFSVYEAAWSKSLEALTAEK